MAVKGQPPPQITLAVSRNEATQAAHGRIRGRIKNNDFVATCVLAVIGLLVSLSLGLTFVVTEDVMMMPGQFP